MKSDPQAPYTPGTARGSQPRALIQGFSPSDIPYSNFCMTPSSPRHSEYPELSSEMEEEEKGGQGGLFIGDSSPRGRLVNNNRATMSTPTRDSGGRDFNFAEDYPLTGKARFNSSSFDVRDQDKEMPQSQEQPVSRGRDPWRQTGHPATRQDPNDVNEQENCPGYRYGKPVQQQDAGYDDEKMDKDEDYPAESSNTPSVRLPRFNPPKNVRPSRFSGSIEAQNVSQDPPMVSQHEVSNASLEKRGLKRGKEDKVCKRGYGANDPENIEIVNLKEHDMMSFEGIAKYLNKKRVDNGREPSLSATGVTSRYNRTAPLLYSAQGLEFVPLSKRGSKIQSRAPFANMWTDELDEILVTIVKAVEREKWIRVAKRFAKETDWDLPTTALATRYKNL